MSDVTMIDQDQTYPVNDPNHLIATSAIKGKSLDVYYYLVNNPGEHGPREVQRALGFSSPSLAAYHLTRLLDHKLVTKTASGNYYVDGDPVRLGELRDHVRVAGRLIPRIITYAYQAIISLIAIIILLMVNADVMIWVLFFGITNLIFLIVVIKDASSTYNRLTVQSD